MTRPYASAADPPDTAAADPPVVSSVAIDGQRRAWAIDPFASVPGNVPDCEAVPAEATWAVAGTP